MKVLLQVVLLRKPGKGQFVLLVVVLDKILDNGTRLPQSQVGVGILDGWETSIGVDFGKGVFLGVADQDLNPRLEKKETQMMVLVLTTL